MGMGMRRFLAGFVASGLLGLLLAASASGAVGGVTQKAGTAGCVSDSGSAGACADVTGISDPHAVVISPDGANAYSASFSDDSIAIFDRNPATGALAQKGGAAGCITETGSGGTCADGRGLNGAISVAVSPDGRSVYATSFFGYAVSIFDRDLSTGALTQKPGTAGCISDTGSGGECVDGTALDTAQSVVVSPDGTSVYVAAQFSGTGALTTFDRNTTSGALTQKAGTAGCITQNGTGPCVDGKGIQAARWVTISPDGANVYVAAQGNDSIAVFDRNSANGVLTQKAGTAGCVSETGSLGDCVDGKALDDPTSVTVSPDGSSVYAGSQTSDAVTVFDRSTSTGALTQKAGTAGCISETGTGGTCVDGKGLDGVSSVLVSPDGASTYATSAASAGVSIFDRNVSTGDISQKAGTDGCVTETGSAGACADGKALDTSQGVAVSPDGANAYVAAQGSGALAIFDRAAFPQTTIDSGPAGPTGDSTPTFTFSSNEPGSTFECRIDAAAFAVCSGPGHSHTSPALADGAHTFEVRAIDLTADTDPTAATRAFTVDTAVPDTTIDSGPQGPTSDETPTFGFSSTQAGSSFECRIDSTAFTPCCSTGATHTTPSLADGPHSFEVRALDPASNRDPSPSGRSFSVDATPPVTRLDKAPKGKLKTAKKSAKVKLTFSAEPGARFECRLDNGSFESCSSPFTAKVKSKPGKGAKHTITVRAIDELGNVEDDPAAASFRMIRKG